MEDRNKWVLIGLQFFHVLLFLIIAICFGVWAFEPKDGDSCYFPCTGEATEGIPCDLKDPITCSCNIKQTYDVTKRFDMVFYVGFFTYLSDAICRLVIVVGLYFGRIYVQFAGVFGTVVVSTFAQTTMLIIMPIYRYNTAGLRCAELSDTNPDPMLYNEGQAISQLLIVVIIVWVLSCCTSFAFNKNDFKREFGYLTQGRHMVAESQNLTETEREEQPLAGGVGSQESRDNRGMN